MSEHLSMEIVAGATNITVRLIGEVDMASKDMLEEAMTQLGVEPRNLIIDLRGVSFMDSMGLSMLVRVHQVCEANGGTLTVRTPQPPVRRLFALTGVDAQLTIVDEDQ